MQRAPAAGAVFVRQCAMNRKPNIGIPSVSHELGLILPVFTTTGHYVAAVQAAGGLPVQLPLTAGMSGNEIAALLGVCDGVLPGQGRGALAAWTPAMIAEITSYTAEQYPDVFEQPSTPILTVVPERTFWEKATILHHEANRPEHLAMPSRYSRHYYDLYHTARTPVKDAAFARLDLL